MPCLPSFSRAVPGSPAARSDGPCMRNALLLAATVVLAGAPLAQARAQSSAYSPASLVGASSSSSFLSSSGFYVQGAKGVGSAHAFTVGMVLPWKGWQRPLWGGQLQGYWDIYVSQWRADTTAGLERDAAALGVTPSFRWLPGTGRHAAWFLEGGVGVVLLDHLYASQQKKFSTRLNFGTHLGVGRSFGAQRQHELALRVQHVSNAGIKKPNPGENFVQLRYTRHF